MATRRKTVIALRKRVILVLSTLMSMVLIAAGCSKGTNTGPTTIVVAVASLSQEHTNPLRVTSVAMMQHLSHIGEGLTILSPAGGVDLDLAKSLEASSDGKTLDVTLKEAKFHNGEPVTAGDVKFTYELVMDPQFGHFEQARLRKGIAEIEVLGDRKLRFHFSKSYPTFPSDANNVYIIPKKYYQSVGLAEFEKHPISAGPFKFVSWEKGQSMTLGAFKDFYDPKRVPAMDTLVYKIIPEFATRLAMVQTGEADIASPIAGPPLETVKANPKLKLISSPTSAFSMLVPTDIFLPGPSPLKDIRVRQALVYAIDRETIGKQLYYGEAVPLQVAGFLPHLVNYPKGLTPLPYDVQKAKELMSAAGYSNGFDIAFTGMTDTPAVYGMPQLLQTVADYWKKNLNVNLKITLMESGTYFSKFNAKSLTGMAVLAGTPVVDVVTTAYNQYYSGSIWTYTADPALDKMIDNANAEFDPQKRQKLSGDVVKYAYDKLYELPLLSVNSVAVVGPKIKGWTRLPGVPYTLGLERIQLAK